jgi:hypothetical protein
MTIGLGIGGHFAKGADDSPGETQRSMRKQIDDLMQSQVGGLRYVEDPHRASADPTKKAHRVAVFKCSNCPCELKLDQYKDADDRWPANAIAQATVFGWAKSDISVSDGGNATHVEEAWFCGQFCRQRYETKMRNHGNTPLPVGARPSAPGYVKDLYAKPVVSPPNAIDAQDGTTPAVPLRPARPAARAK